MNQTISKAAPFVSPIKNPPLELLQHICPAVKYVDAAYKVNIYFPSILNHCLSHDPVCPYEKQSNNHIFYYTDHQVVFELNPDRTVKSVRFIYDDFQISFDYNSGSEVETSLDFTCIISHQSEEISEHYYRFDVYSNIPFSFFEKIDKLGFFHATFEQKPLNMQSFPCHDYYEKFKRQDPSFSFKAWDFLEFEATALCYSNTSLYSLVYSSFTIAILFINNPYSVSFHLELPSY